MYGGSFIEPYKDKLKEFFEQGNKRSSKKINAAMMREELQKLYPYVFPIPGETEIKRFISPLFSKSKSSRKSYNDESMDIELNEEATSLFDDNQSPLCNLDNNTSKIFYIYRRSILLIKYISDKKKI